MPPTFGLETVTPCVARVNPVCPANAFNTKVFNPCGDVLIDDLELGFLGIGLPALGWIEEQRSILVPFHERQEA